MSPPRFSGRIFSLEQYMDWYAARYGDFTYYQDWEGFNVPSTALRPFYEGKFDPLSEKEKRLLRLFENLRKRFYIIGIHEGGAKNSLTHELAHALFFMDASYRRAVHAAMRGFDTSALTKQLAEAGYAKHVISGRSACLPGGALRQARRGVAGARAAAEEIARALQRPCAGAIGAQDQVKFVAI